LYRYALTMTLPTELDRLLGYIGSIGQQYCPEIMLDVAMALRSRYPDLKFKIFSADGDNMKKAFRNKDLTNAEWISIERIAPHDVTSRLARCDVGLSFRQPMFSTQGIAPIKLGDYLLAGVPISRISWSGKYAAASRCWRLFPLVMEAIWMTLWSGSLAQ